MDFPAAVSAYLDALARFDGHALPPILVPADWNAAAEANAAEIGASATRTRVAPMTRPVDFGRQRPRRKH
jgi:hypothetical protein